MNRRGLGIVSDIMSFVIFLIATILVYLFLFQPLVEDNITRSTTTRHIMNNAQYTALTFANYPGRPDALSGSVGTLPTVIRQSIALYRTDKDEWERTLDQSAYVRTVNGIYATDAPVWDDVKDVRSVAVFLMEDDAIVEESCKDYMNPRFSDNDGLCGFLYSATVVTEEHSGLSIPNFGTSENPRDRQVSYGALIIPTAGKPVSLYVAYLYESGRQ